MHTSLHQQEELAEGLHLIDFEQLKIENQTYNEKIEERNEVSWNYVIRQYKCQMSRYYSKLASAKGGNVKVSFIADIHTQLLLRIS